MFPIKRLQTRSESYPMRSPLRQYRHLMLGALVLTFPLNAAAGEYDAEDARRLREAGEILPLGQLLGRAETIRPGRLIEAELEYDERRKAMIYEFEILDAHGVVWEVKLDARTGTLLEQETEYP